ncbi:MAG: two-component regulator propeller domain-containing protein [Candidatus Sulfotelmatobacter sp.]
MKAALALITISTISLLLGAAPVLALDPSLEVSQYSHTAWTARDGLSVGAIFAMAQTPDGYLWLGTENGLFRFDGVRSIPWQPPAGQHLTSAPYSLLVTHDGTLWIGTFTGLASWNGNKLTQYPEFDGLFVTSLLEDRAGTVWAGTFGRTSDTPGGRLCAIRSGRAECYLQGGAFGVFVFSLGEDGSGALWAGAESGLWRWKPGPPRRYPMPGMRIDDLSKADDGQVLIAIREAGLKHVVGDKVETYPIPSAVNPNALLPDRDVNSNKLLRDRDGGLWIGTHERGLIHVHQGRTEIFRKADGLSGDISCSLFEDREGNVWVGTSSGLDRFRDLTVTTISLKQGLSDVDSNSVMAATDGAIWIATHHGLARWKDGKATVFRKANGLPDDMVQSLFQDAGGRIWAFTAHGLAYFTDGKFVAVSGVPSHEVYSIAGDKAGNLWLSGTQGLSHMRDGRLVEHFPWSAMGRHQQAKVIVSDDQGGLWLAFWTDGGVLYFKDGQVRASYTAADGLGKGHVPGLRLDRDGAVWAGTEEGGLSRIKDGHIATLTTKNGLPCDAIYWSIEDDDRSFWLYTACGLVRVTRSELDAWIADPTHRIETTVWDAADGVRVVAVPPASFGPPVAKSTDGRLWFHSGEGIEVVDPRHVAFNKLPPPVHIEQIVADNKTYWQNLPDAAVPKLRLPPHIRDLEIDYVGLSLVAPEKMQFRVKLEGQDNDWRVPVNPRHAHYTNLPPRSYRFRVIASNNSGVWNELGDTLEFSVAPAYYQTNWFRGFCAAAFLALLWAAYQLRVRQLHHQFAMTLEARVGERTRIARDLHDTLLQSFHGLVFRFQAVRNMLPNRPEEATQALDVALNRAEQALDEGRHSIQELRPGATAESALDQVLITTGQELASSHGKDGDSPGFEVIVEGERRGLAPMVQEEVIRIARELLRNAFQHARAHRIEAEIRYDNHVFRMLVRDDGKGIDPKILKDGGRPGHWGMAGVHERARGIGARLEFWSEAGAGTEVRLTLPAAIAYEKPRNGARFRPFRKWRIHEHQS